MVLCDRSESELGILDLIQVYVETLDRSFESVCELDLIFNSPKARGGPRASDRAVRRAVAALTRGAARQAYAILDEIVMGGAVFETSSLEALRAFNELQRLEKASESMSTSGSSPQSAKFGAPGAGMMASMQQQAGFGRR